MKVREVLRLLAHDGWYLVSIRGSHRQYKHGTKAGRVTVPGNPVDDLAQGTLKSIGKQAGLKIQEQAMRYAVVIEKATNNYSAYAPDLPGCVATGASAEEAGREMREAIAFHLEGLKQDGLQIPLPTSRVDYVDVSG